MPTVRPISAPDPAPPDHRRIVFDPSNVWRVGWVVLALLAAAMFIRFVVQDGGTVIFLVILAWFASLAMEPAVRTLSRTMPRAAATSTVMAAVAVFLVVFLLAFGRLFVDQLAQLIRALPDVVGESVSWLNRTLGTDYSLQDAVDALHLTPDRVAQYTGDVLGGVLGVFGSIVGVLFSGFTFLFFTFYLSAGGPRLRRWIAQRLPARQQELFVSAWDLTTTKTGGYVAARITLATINAATTAIVFVIIGMPAWFALAIWTGLVAQFVPTIGTYISIALPVLIGLLSPQPWVGVAALVWAIVYQQVENLTLEPRISARAVDVNPAVAFGAVLLGGALFGAAGALLAVPVAAMLLALFELRGTLYDLVPEADEPGKVPPDILPPSPDSKDAEVDAPDGAAPVD